jgi:hypothetical protein
MPLTYDEIAANFLDGVPAKKSMFNKVRTAHRGWTTRGPLSARHNTFFLSYGLEHKVFGESARDEELRGIDTDTLWSFEHYALAVKFPNPKTKKLTVVLNGDAPPTLTTGEQMRALRRAADKRVDRTGKSNNPIDHVALIPFTSLRAAGIQDGQIRYLRILHTTKDTVIKPWRPCRSKECRYHDENVLQLNSQGDKSVRPTPGGPGHEHITEDHFLGETLFAYGDKYYVCGLDRNDDPRRRNFYLATLPASKKPPKTVDEALERLRPKGLPKDESVLRQGEFFFVPTPKLKPKKEAVYTKVSYAGRIAYDAATNARYQMTERLIGIPIISDQPDEMATAITNASQFSPLIVRRRRHRASRVHLNGHVYVQGILQDAEHGPLKLGDGKTWYRVVKNQATASWGAARDGQGRGRVD